MKRRRAAGGARAAAEAPTAAPDARIERAADLVVLAVVVVALVRLGVGAAHAGPVSDECYHLRMAAWVGTHGTLPRELPGLYGGFKSFYPPLLHLLAAPFVRLFGFGAAPFVSLGVFAALLAGVALTLRRLATPAAARVAVLLVLACPALVFHAVSFYVEGLTALVAAGVLLALLAIHRRPTTGGALALGALAGLAVLAKQSGIAAPALLALLAAVAAVRRDAPLARALAVALVVSLAVAAPYWIRNALLYGSPIYPALGRDLHAGLAEMARRGFTPGPVRYARDLAAAAGPLGLAALAAGLAALRRPSGADVPLLVVLALLMAGPVVPMFGARHATPLLAGLAVATALAGAAALARRPRALLAAQGLLVVAAALCLAPDPRHWRNVSPHALESYAAIRQLVPAGATVLTRDTYDTFHYAERAATWPIPYGQKDPPVDVLTATEPWTLLERLHRHDIRYLVVPAEPRGEAFGGANFPRPFLVAVGGLVRAGLVTVAWDGGDLALMRVARPGETPR